jgi:hypothetical protein
VPKDLIKLKELQMGNLDLKKNDNKTIHILDEKLTRFKEVEELYQEIMKSVSGEESESDDGKSSFI